jgi:hypothetical protein
MNKLVLIFAALVCISCAHVPLATVQLSEELTGMILAAERSHIAMIEQYMDDRRDRADMFLDSVGIPSMMEKMVNESSVMDDLEAADAAGKAAIMSEFTADAANEIADWRNSMMRALDEVEDLLKTEVHNHYMDMLAVNTALTAHLRSAADVTETRQRILGALRVDPDKLIPLDQINARLEKIIRAKEKIEDVAGQVNEVRAILTNGNSEGDE